MILDYFYSNICDRVTVILDLDFQYIKLVSATPRRLIRFLEALQISLLWYEHVHVVLGFLFYHFVRVTAVLNLEFPS